MALSAVQIDSFIAQGFVRLDEAFPRAVAADCRALLDQRADVRHDDPATWREPVIRLPGYWDPPFIAAANSPRLTAAFDQLVGPIGWVPLPALGTFVLRFPVPGPVTDDGWHIDVSFAEPTDDPNDFFAYRANATSRGRALLLLFLLTDVGEHDAPTRIRIGSHLSMTRRLAPYGDAGRSLRDLAAEGFDDTAHLPEATAHGPAGTVFLCHPHLVHAAQRHEGGNARYLAQPPLLPRAPFDVAAGASPVERSLREALGRP